jgi:hypothetical protein
MRVFKMQQNYLLDLRVICFSGTYATRLIFVASTVDRLANDSLSG